MKDPGLKKFCRASLALPIAASFLTLTACAVQRPFRFAPKSISRIVYDPRNCSQMLDGTFKCRDVIFTVTMVEAPTK
jgi:hypothetical protein